MTGPTSRGDLGRRAARRREELGLDRQEVARRAGMASEYVAYLEEHSAEASRATLARLAAALETSVAELLGEGESAPGRARPGRRSLLEPLPADEADAMLRRGGVGRVVFVGPRGPEALPVNFALLEGDVVYRTRPGSEIDLPEGTAAGFEVDRIDDAAGRAWSVLVKGHLHPIEDRDELARALALGIEPWPGEDRDRYLRLRAEEVTGRRVTLDA